MTAGPDRRRLRAAAAVACLAALLPALVSIPALPGVTAAAVPAQPTAQPTARDGVDSDDPLAIELTSISPSTLRVGAELVLRGRVTNVDAQDWRNIQVYLAISPSPLTTRAELSATNDSPAESYFGDRVTDTDTFAELGRLRPGEDGGFRLQVPWRSLRARGVSGAPGVYTVGAQVLATDEDGARPPEAQGRARTYLPLVDPATTSRVRLAMVWRVGAQVLRRRDGTYARAERLTAAMAADGPLRRVVDLGATAGSVPLTVVPDPAVLDAAQDLATGRYGPPGGLVQRPGAEDSGTAPDGVATQADAPPQARAPDPVPVVADWLEDAVALAGTGPGWTTPYGEPSVDTLAAVGSDALDSSVAVATRAAQRLLLGRPASVLALPDGGVVSTDGLDQIADADPSWAAVLTPRMLPGWDFLDGSAQRLETGTGLLDTVVADPTLSAGGPAPGVPLSALQVRQRLLAETALLATQAAGSGARAPLTATFVSPEQWNPGADWEQADFFAGLEDVPWLEPVALDEQLEDATGYDGQPGVGNADIVAELSRVAPEATTSAALQLRRRARLLATLVGEGRGLRVWYDSAVALAVSESTLRDPLVQQRLVRSVAERMTRLLRGVSLTGPAFVTLSSSRGSFPLTITNELDRPVAVSVRVRASRGASTLGNSRFDTDARVVIAPGQRDTVTIDARVGRVGVTSARAYVITTDGRRFGVPLAFNLRTSVVGAVIWAILGVACAVLVVAVVRRLWRRRRVRGPEASPS